MNISGRKKHHIFTIVIGGKWLIKRILPFFLILFILFALNISKYTQEGLSAIARLSMIAKNPLKNRDVVSRKSSLPNIYQIARVSSPFLIPRSNHNYENENIKLNTKTPSTPNEKTSEKTLASSGLEIINSTSYTVDVNSLTKKKIAYNAISDSKKVLIVHTHGCETYSDSTGKGLGQSGSYRTTDTKKNVTSIGKIIATELEKRGVEVIYDNTLCDTPSYNASYKKSMEVTEKHIRDNPDIRFVFDIHRDAIEDSDKNPVKLTAEINGEKYAQVMIVCGTDASGLNHPHWQENLTLGLKIQQRLEDKYPGLARPLNLREERFNMHETKGSLIFEIGTHGNTLEEAEKSAVLLANAVCDVICN
ncbi:MAG: hypothetical protein E7394_01710 [Ruminococcaceae bacterium]|nr:hypothetical protein [Oscillospiraceae bacterium]